MYCILYLNSLNFCNFFIQRVTVYWLARLLTKLEVPGSNLILVYDLFTWPFTILTKIHLPSETELWSKLVTPKYWNTSWTRVTRKTTLTPGEWAVLRVLKGFEGSWGVLRGPEGYRGVQRGPEGSWIGSELFQAC